MVPTEIKALTPKKEAKSESPFPCTAPGCTKGYSSAQGRNVHILHKHSELYDELVKVGFTSNSNKFAEKANSYGAEVSAAIKQNRQHFEEATEGRTISLKQLIDPYTDKLYVKSNEEAVETFERCWNSFQDYVETVTMTELEYEVESDLEKMGGRLTVGNDPSLMPDNADMDDSEFATMQQIGVQDEELNKTQFVDEPLDESGEVPPTEEEFLKIREEVTELIMANKAKRLKKAARKAALKEQMKQELENKLAELSTSDEEDDGDGDVDEDSGDDASDEASDVGESENKKRKTM